MQDDSKRTYVKYAGASLAALSLGVGGSVAVNNGAVRSVAPNDLQTGAGTAPVQQQVRPTSGDRLDYERDEDGDVEFLFEGVSFETRNAGADVEFTVDADTNDAGVDLEVSDDGEGFELSMSIGSDFVDLEVDGDDVEFEAIGASDTFEDEDDEIEYRGSEISLEFENDVGDLEVTGADVSLEFDAEVNELEYRDSVISLEFEGEEEQPSFEAIFLGNGGG